MHGHGHGHAHGHDTATSDGPPPGTPEFWEGFYRDREQIWSGRPNPVLVEVAEPMTPGTALDLGAGEGGDALWLAAQGWTVTAVDVAQTALDRIAPQVGELPVTLERHDLSMSFPAGRFDLVSAQYLHSPDPAVFAREAVLRRAMDAVAPGGTLLVVGHGKLPPFAWDPTARMPEAQEVLADLAPDPAVWDVVRCDSPERTATGPEGQTATITDEIVVLRRR